MTKCRTIGTVPQQIAGCSVPRKGLGYLARKPSLCGIWRDRKVDDPWARVLSAQDYDAELAERYGWINRALPASVLDDFVSSLAQRIAKFPGAGLIAVKERINAIALASADDFRLDSDLFGEAVQKVEAQSGFQAAFRHGFQTRDGEMDLGRWVGELSVPPKDSV